MNILQVTEIYKIGGLENYIDSFSSELRSRGCKSFLAVGDYDPPNFDDVGKCQDGIFFDFGFKEGSVETIHSFIEDINRLCAIIKNNEIDFVLIHPFYSLFPALIASKILKVPCGYVVHGVYSCSFPMTPLINAFFRLALDCSVDHVFVTQDYFKTFVYSETPVTMLRNPVKPVSFRVQDSDLLKSKRWALCSRLDEVKGNAIRELLRNMKSLDISYLDIWGDGELADELKMYASKLGLDEVIFWHGHDSNWLNHVHVKDCGVIGLGRVAIEALSSNIPVILLGVEGGICGLVDRDLFNQSIESNFGKIGLPTLGVIEDLNLQLASFYTDPRPYLLGEKARDLFSAERIVDIFLEAIERLTNAGETKRSHEWDYFYKLIKQISQKDTSFNKSLDFADALFSSLSVCIPFGIAKNSLFTMNEWSLTSKRLDLAEARLDQLTDFVGNQSREIDELRTSLNRAQVQLFELDNFVLRMKNMILFKIYRGLKARLMGKE